MTAPFDQFRQVANKFHDSDNLLDKAVANVIRNLETSPDNGRLPQAFLSAQAELLIGQKTSLHLKPLKGNSLGSQSAGIYDPRVNELNITVPKGSDRNIDIAKTAAHEMTHGIEATIMGSQAENKITQILSKKHTTGENRPQDEIKLIFDKTQSIFPEESQIKQQYEAQMIHGGYNATLPREIGAYSNEALFDEIRATGGVGEFVQRYNSIRPHDIEVKGLSKREEGKIAREHDARITAQEIIAVSIYDINNHIIDRLENRKFSGDVELKGILQRVNDELKPAYESAQLKYKGIFSKESQQHGKASSEMAESVQYEPELSATTVVSSLDNSGSSAAILAWESLDTTVASRASSPVSGIANFNPLLLQEKCSSPEAGDSRTYSQMRSNSNSPDNINKRVKSESDNIDAQTDNSQPPSHFGQEIGNQRSQSNSPIPNTSIVEEDSPGFYTPPSRSRSNSPIPNAIIVEEDSSQFYTPPSTPPVSPTTLRRRGGYNIS